MSWRVAPRQLRPESAASPAHFVLSQAGTLLARHSISGLSFAEAFLSLFCQFALNTNNLYILVCLLQALECASSHHPATETTTHTSVACPGNTRGAHEERQEPTTRFSNPNQPRGTGRPLLHLLLMIYDGDDIGNNDTSSTSTPERRGTAHEKPGAHDADDDEHHCKERQVATDIKPNIQGVQHVADQVNENVNHVDDKVNGIARLTDIERWKQPRRRLTEDTPGDHGRGQKSRRSSNGSFIHDINAECNENFHIADDIDSALNVAPEKLPHQRICALRIGRIREPQPARDAPPPRSKATPGGYSLFCATTPSASR